MGMSKFPKFQGNALIRKGGYKLEYEPWQLEEIFKCASDAGYFIRKYVRIKNVDAEDLILFDLREYQQRMIDLMINFRESIAKWPRQSGKSSCVSAALLWMLIFNRNHSILVAAHRGEKARDILGIIKEMYEQLPYWLQHGVVEWNKGNIKLETGSRIKASATTGTSARGDVYNIVYIDEASFIASHIAKEFFESVIPTISSGKTTKICITSTPKGLNHFHTMWQAAVDGKSGYEYVDIKWNDVPGRDDAFRAKVIAQFGQDYFDQEYGAEFIGSSATLIAGWKLMMLSPDNPIDVDEARTFRIYQKPYKGGKYVIIVDVAEGLGGDASAAVIVDVTRMPYEVAAVYQNNRIDPYTFPTILAPLGRMYNDAMILVEANFGQTVADVLWRELEYENVIFTTRKQGQDKVSGGFAPTTKRAGVIMSNPVRLAGCTKLKAIAETDKVIFRDKPLIDELKRFALKGRKYQAEEGHDDLAMCMVMFAWLIDSEYMMEITDTNVANSIGMQNQRIADETVAVLGGREVALPDFDVPLAVSSKNDDWLLRNDDDPTPSEETLTNLERWMRHGWN